jgi:hypothetical protein
MSATQWLRKCRLHSQISSPNQLLVPIPIPEPGEAASSPPQTKYLFCNTHRFYFSIDLQTRDPPTRAPQAAYLRSSSGQFAGVLFYQSALDRNDMTTKKAPRQTVEVVATSRGYISEIRRLLFPIMTKFEVRRHSLGAIDEDGDSGWEWFLIKEWYNVL